MELVREGGSIAHPRKCKALGLISGIAKRICMNQDGRG